MVGTYAPESLSDPRVHADTRLELRGDGTCRMTDFPYVNYASSESSTLSYSTKMPLGRLWALAAFGS